MHFKLFKMKIILATNINMKLPDISSELLMFRRNILLVTHLIKELQNVPSEWFEQNQHLRTNTMRSDGTL